MSLPDAEPCRPYRPVLDARATERAIKLVKDTFEAELAGALGLRRVTAPLLVAAGTGVNDDLNGVERPVRFSARALPDAEVEVVQSLAKWKRLALADLGFGPGEGLYTDMNAIRPDEVLDDEHSLYVDQWDWELVIREEDRTLDSLSRVVRAIYGALCRTEDATAASFPGLGRLLPDRVELVHAAELEARRPDLSPAEREHLVAERHGAVFVVGIGGDLPGGAPHDGRAPDYDDWSTPNGRGLGLNGDLILWCPWRRRALELSSMGIRVTPDALRHQLRVRGCPERARLPFHQRLLAGELPLSVGGGIGQSRLCMWLLRKAHIGEVQAGLWPRAVREDCRRRGVPLL